MRVVDFFVFYVTTLFKNKPRGNLFWDSPVRRTMFVVGLTFTLLLFSILEIIVFLIARINIMGNRLSEIAGIIGGVLLIQLLGYVYIVKKRYEFIISSQYRAFTLNANLGAAICVVICLLSFFLMIGVAGAIHIFLKTHGR